MQYFENAKQKISMSEIVKNYFRASEVIRYKFLEL